MSAREEPTRLALSFDTALHEVICVVEQGLSLHGDSCIVGLLQETSDLDQVLLLVVLFDGLSEVEVVVPLPHRVDAVLSVHRPHRSESTPAPYILPGVRSFF